MAYSFTSEIVKHSTSMATDIEKEMQVIADLPDKEHFINDEIFIVAHRFKTSSLDCFF